MSYVEHCKTRVALIKQQAIPRLELLGVLILVYCWIDSMTVLQWVKNKHVYRQYVQNRIDEIRQKTDGCLMLALEVEGNGLSKVIDIKRYSSFNLLFRVSAYVLRFIKNVRKYNWNRQDTQPLLEASELQLAEMMWIHSIQYEFFLEAICYLKQLTRKKPILVDQFRLLLMTNRLYVVRAESISPICLWRLRDLLFYQSTVKLFIY